MMKLIIAQDRDQQYVLDDKSRLYSVPLIYDEICMGYNLMLDDDVIGSFDQPEECAKEAENIYKCEEIVYAVSGHSNGGFASW